MLGEASPHKQQARDSGTMDSLRGFDDDAAFAAAEEEPAMDHPPEIGVDERRMHVRAYNYWVSLLAGRPYPSIEDVDPASIEDFGANSVLLDFSRDQNDPEIAFLGRALREECGFDSSIRRISEVPARSLLSRLTDHYLQIIANRAPIGFEAEFMGRRGNATLYRGILMPLSSDGAGIDFIYGVINWKELADAETAGILSDEVARAAAPVAECSVWADGPNADLPTSGSPADEEDHPALGLWDEDAPLAPDASLADRLCLARRIADAAREADQRGRAALYRAIGHAWDFALAAEAAPEDFAEILADAGLKAQARAPMTPVVKLVFGAGYDKTRLTEFAAALCWAQGMGTTHTLCHGDLGMWEVITAAQRAGVGPAVERSTLEGHIISSLEEHGPHTTASGNITTPGLLHGLSGIAYQLLRMHPDSDLPSVLLPDPQPA
jgi:hypothetical protein